jgi:flagellar motor switch protein FliN/FliY
MAESKERNAKGAGTPEKTSGATSGVNINSTLEELSGDGANVPTAVESPTSRVSAEAGVEILSQEEPPEPSRASRDLEAVYDVPVQLSAVLGRSNMLVSQLLKLGRGAVVELDRKVGEAIDIYVNNRLVARGEVVVVEERLGVTMTEIIKTDRAS